jgi:hypothetical protein
MASLPSLLISAIESEDLDAATALLDRFLADASINIQGRSVAEAQQKVLDTLQVLKHALLLTRGVRSQISANLHRTIGESSYTEAAAESHLVGFVA